MVFFTELEQIISKFACKQTHTKTWIAKAILRKKNGIGGTSTILQSYSHQNNMVLTQK